MKKRKDFAFGKSIYLLGEDINGRKYWLEESSWECGWYWGLGYVETYTNNNHPSSSRDIYTHQHFDELILKNGKAKAFDRFKLCFPKNPFSDKEIWTILEIMESLYLMQQYSDILHIGGAQISKNPCSELIKNADEYDRINKKIIPELNQRLYNTLCSDEVTQ